MKKALNVVFSRVAFTALLVIMQLSLFAFEIIKLQQQYVFIALILRLISVLVVAYLLCKPTNPSVKLAWIVPILVFPVLGGLMYLLFGHVAIPKKLQKKLEQIPSAEELGIVQDEKTILQLQEKDYATANLSRYITQYATLPIYKDTKTQYFSCGEDYWKKLLEDLRQAKEFIFLEYFIIDKGVMWGAIYDILKEKVKEGVEVRVIYDDVGSAFTLPKNYATEVEQDGISCIAFNQIFPFMAMILNNRDHRKIAVIDGKVSYTGGMNLADEYINEVEKFGRWKDAGVRMEGKAVDSFTYLFLQIWSVYRFDREDFTKYLKKVQPKTMEDTEGFVQPYGTNPLYPEVVGQNIYMNIINAAKHYVYIFTPYLIVNNEMITALRLAAKRGVDVRIVTPGVPDKKSIYRLTQSYYKELVTDGVKVYQYTPGFIHSKCFLCDDDVAAVGTINMDYRSFYHHFECGTLLYQARACVELKQDMEETFPLCEQIDESWCKAKFSRNSLFDAILKLLSPLF